MKNFTWREINLLSIWAQNPSLYDGANASHITLLNNAARLMELPLLAERIRQASAQKDN